MHAHCLAYTNYCCIIVSWYNLYIVSVLAFVRTNRRAIAMMLICLSGMGVHVTVDLSLWLDSPMFCAH